MRSRYSAFCQGNVDYLVETHHRDHRSPDERKSLGNSVKQTQWTNLIVVKTQQGQRKDKTGTVEFVAAYRSASLLGIQVSTDPRTTDPQTTDLQKIGPKKISLKAIEQLHERSQFVREKGQWFYTNGEILPDYVPKRSHPCWCGSQIPFNHCHG